MDKNQLLYWYFRSTDLGNMCLTAGSVVLHRHLYGHLKGRRPGIPGYVAWERFKHL